MDLHRSLRSDWSNITPQERNIWQRLAAASYGVFTPGNVISVIGGITVIWGLYLFYRNQLIEGCGAIVIGRLCDLLDGLVAEHTKTKSPFGEFVDATIDKILIVLALFVLVNLSLIPLLVGTVLFIHSCYMIGIASVARIKRIRIHPSASGKYATAFAWVCVSLYVLEKIIKNADGSSKYITFAAEVCFVGFIFTG
ncbi:MAG: CDP-alcohol phosphatidyltransferase family protein, partial [Candidatus Saccharimonadales bacterium]